MTPPTISILIATYTRATFLDETLQHLARQAFIPGDEVIVIDNGSRDNTSQLVTERQAGFPVPLTLLYEDTPGKSHALARGLERATGDVIAFVDDDVNVAADWIEVVRRTMMDPDVGMMGGRVLPRWEPSVPAWMREVPTQHARLGAPIGVLDYSPVAIQAGPRTLLGGNMAVRRSVFNTVGGFATHLGKIRGTLLSGEDHELTVRVQRAGFKAIYIPEAIVHHYIPADRTRVGYFVHWFYWSGITNAILDEDSGVARTGRSLAGVPLYIAKRVVTGALATGRAMVRGRRHTALLHATDVAFAAGYAAKRLGLH
jgi:glycosyltransferase involved in cell wall biosynthesis